MSQATKERFSIEGEIARNEAGEITIGGTPVAEYLRAYLGEDCTITVTPIAISESTLKHPRYALFLKVHNRSQDEMLRLDPKGRRFKEWLNQSWNDFLELPSEDQTAYERYLETYTKTIPELKRG